jgi:hypothetical protein
MRLIGEQAELKPDAFGLAERLHMRVRDVHQCPLGKRPLAGAAPTDRRECLENGGI